MRIGRLEATGGFFLLLAWLNYLDRQRVVPMALSACFLHELGHYLVIRWSKGDIKYIRLTAIGAEMSLVRPLGYWQEGLAALAGPCINLLLAAIFCRWEWGALFAGINIVLGVFNLLPAAGLDGGRALYCALALSIGPDGAERIGEWLNLLCTGLLLAASLLLGVGGNVTLLLVLLWLMVQEKHAFGNG